LNSDIKKALDFAVKAHIGQKRKCSDIPYIVHPIGVGLLLMNNLECDEVVIAGVLHDVLEDTEFNENDIKINFGERVLELVKEASEPDHNNKSWEDRKKHTIDNLNSISYDGLKVAIADKINNLESMNNDFYLLGEELWLKFNATKDRQKWYYSELKKVFEKRIPADNMLIRRFLHFYKIFE